MQPAAHEIQIVPAHRHQETQRDGVVDRDERIDGWEGIAAPSPTHQRLDRGLVFARAGAELAERLAPAGDLWVRRDVSQRLVLTHALLDVSEEQRRLFHATAIVDVPADDFAPAVAGELLEDLGMDLI